MTENRSTIKGLRTAINKSKARCLGSLGTRLYTFLPKNRRVYDKTLESAEGCPLFITKKFEEAIASMKNRKELWTIVYI